MFCCTLLYVHFSIAIILMGKRELVALLNLSSWCRMMVEWLFLAVPWGCLRCVIVVFPDHTHLLFLVESPQSLKLIPYGVKLVDFMSYGSLVKTNTALVLQSSLVTKNILVFSTFRTNWLTVLWLIHVPSDV